MSRKLEEVRIDGELYQIGQWPVDKSLEVLTWLTKTLGETVTSLIGAHASIDDFMDKDLGESIGPAIRSLIPRLQEKEIRDKARQITDGILCNGKLVVYDVHFMGQIGHLFKVMVEVLKVQYADFFGALSAVKYQPPAAAQRDATIQES